VQAVLPVGHCHWAALEKVKSGLRVVLPTILISPGYRQEIAQLPCIASLRETMGEELLPLLPHAVKKRDNIKASTVFLFPDITDLLLLFLELNVSTLGLLYSYSETMSSLSSSNISNIMKALSSKQGGYAENAPNPLPLLLRGRGRKKNSIASFDHLLL
jgi:hypothetical protein